MRSAAGTSSPAGLRGSRRRGRATRRRSGYPLGVSPAHVWQHHAIQGDSIVAQPWTGTVAELEETAAASVARDLTNRIFLAAGAGQPYFFDTEGRYTG